VRRRHQLPARETFQLAAANALDPDQLRDATRGFTPDRPIAVVSEGLLQYLSPAELETVTQNVRGLLSTFGGTWITSDFSLKDEVGPVSERQRRFRAVVAAATDRQLYDSAFDNDAALQAFLARCRLVSEPVNQLDLVPEVVSMRTLALAPETLARLAPRLKLWIVRPSD
jgi:O-methyltransferase involved in polyketide biosynthesis